MIKHFTLVIHLTHKINVFLQPILFWAMYDLTNKSPSLSNTVESVTTRHYFINLVHSNCCDSHQKHLLLALKDRIIRDDRWSVAAKVMGNYGEELLASSSNLFLSPFFISASICSKTSKPLAICCLLSFPKGIFLISDREIRDTWNSSKTDLI